MTDIASPNVKRYLDLSTGHARREEAEAFDFFTRPDRDNEHFIIVPHRYGAWVHVWDAEVIEDYVDADAGFETEWQSLLACMDEARKHGCDWINFDSDAERMEALPACLPTSGEGRRRAQRDVIATAQHDVIAIASQMHAQVSASAFRYS